MLNIEEIFKEEKPKREFDPVPEKPGWISLQGKKFKSNIKSSVIQDVKSLKK